MLCAQDIGSLGGKMHFPVLGFRAMGVADLKGFSAL